MTDATKGNRLADEKSPYLLQHAANPVDWYPWGDEAFERAREEDKPIFLSIGYSTCHWCHVMAHESFEDDDVARLMNDAFVNIKVDREERPDVDATYMTVCQMMTGSGGWPLTVLLTPDKRPFFAGTYIPKESRFGRMGMKDLVPRVVEAWDSRRDELLRTADDLVGHLEREPAAGERAPGPEASDAAVEAFATNFDAERGGFGGAPKFPTAHNHLFLLRYARRTGDDDAVRMVVRTLDAMRDGGIWDHVGHGFHRYATDARWFLPHFEKMLYDQALLTIAYTEAYQVTGEGRFARTAHEILDYVRRDLTSQEGVFLSSEDADSEGEEGKFYVWRHDDLAQTLDADDLAFATKAWGLRAEGNFVDEATRKPSGANVLAHPRRPQRLAEELGLSFEAFDERLEAVRTKLLRARDLRVRPHRDDKVLADWNGLMIAAFAKAGRALDRPDHVEAARKAVARVLQRLRRRDGRLLHRWRDHEAGIDGFLDDHAFLVWGLIELHQAAFDAGHLKDALAVQAVQDAHFWDETAGVYRFTADDAETVLSRRAEHHDGAVPSGNSVSLSNLLRLARLTGDARHEERAERLARSYTGRLERMPTAFSMALCGLEFAHGATREIVVAGEPDDAETTEFLRIVNERFLPDTLVHVRPREPDPRLLEAAPWLEDIEPPSEGALAYVCRDFACDRPTRDPDRLRIQLEPPAAPTA